MQAPFHIREARPDEIGELAAWRLALWGDGESEETYAAQTQTRMANAWARERCRFVVGLNDNGLLVTSCKVYTLDAWLDGAEVTVAGIGSVFTPEAHRRRGYAADMLRLVLAQAEAEGTEASFLFSDIGEAYYAQFGYRPVPVFTGQAAALPGPSPFRQIPAPPAAWQERPASGFAFARTPDYWDYLRLIRPLELWAYAPGGVAAGYIAVELDEDEPEELWIREAGYDGGVEPDDFWRGVRSLAGALGHRHVGAWLPTPAPGFDLSPLAQPVPMMLMLNGRPLPTDCRVWSNDHF